MEIYYLVSVHLSGYLDVYSVHASSNQNREIQKGFCLLNNHAPIEGVLNHDIGSAPSLSLVGPSRLISPSTVKMY